MPDDPRSDMPDAENGSEAAETVKPGMPKQKKMMIFGGIFIVQAVAVIGLGQVLIKPRLSPPDSASVVADDTDRGTIVMLDDLTVNLLSSSRARYLRVKIGLEVDDPIVQAELEDRKPEIRDLIITTLSGRKVDQLISVQGKNQLKEELKHRINTRLENGKLLNVYFSDFVVQ